MWHTIEMYPDYEIKKTGEVRHKKLKTIKKQRLNDSGYVVVGINKNGQGRTERVHRLIAMTFIPNPNNLPFVNHIDGIKTNNDLSNLEWCTCSENNKHAFGSGLINNTGEKNGMAVLTESKVIEIKKLLQRGGLSQQKIADQFSVSRSCILKIHLNKMWNHVKI